MKKLIIVLGCFFSLLIFPFDVNAVGLPELSTCILGCGDLGKEKPIDNLYCEKIYSKDGYNYYEDMGTLWNIFDSAKWSAQQTKIERYVNDIHLGYNLVKKIANDDGASKTKIKKAYNGLVTAELEIMTLENDADFPCFFYQSSSEQGFDSTKCISKDQIKELKKSLEDLYANKTTFGCEMLLGANYLNSSQTYKMIKKVVNIVKIVIPVLLIVYGSYDFASAVVASSYDDMSKARNRFIKRIAIALLIFFVPMIINLLMDAMSNGSTVCSLDNL